MAAVSAIFGVLGSVLSAAGAMQQAQAQAAAAEYNQKVLENQAKQRREAAGAEAKDYRRQEHRKLSAAQTARASTGVVLSAGSPLMIDEAAVREIALGSNRNIYQGQVEGTRLENEAELEGMKADYAKQAGYIAAGSSLLSGFGSIFGAWQ